MKIDGTTGADGAHAGSPEGTELHGPARGNDPLIALIARPGRAIGGKPVDMIIYQA
jgi:hypothetical protein